MRVLCPNFEREDALETILDVPIPEELFTSMGNSVNLRWQNMSTWMRAQTVDKWSSPIIANRYNELTFLLYIIGSPLLPLQIQLDNRARSIRSSSIEASTAKYIVQQYMAAIGGQPALNAVQSLCAIGQLKISASDFHQGDETLKAESREETGGFVLWQKNPNLWCLELLVSGCKVISGSNGKISWRQSSNQLRPVSKGPPRPLRRFLQGLDPRSTGDLFLQAVCIGEKVINEEECFILKIDTSQSDLEAHGDPRYEIIHHTIWGYFSQRSGLLVKFEDSRLLTVNCENGDGIFWETSTESVIEDYRYVEGVNIAHSGKTSVTIFRYGEQSSNHKRQFEEKWKIEEVHFNVWGLTNEFFYAPSRNFKRGQNGLSAYVITKRGHFVNTEKLNGFYYTSQQFMGMSLALRDRSDKKKGFEENFVLGFSIFGYPSEQRLVYEEKYVMIKYHANYSTIKIPFMLHMVCSLNDQVHISDFQLKPHTC